MYIKDSVDLVYQRGVLLLNPGHYLDFKHLSFLDRMLPFWGHPPLSKVFQPVSLGSGKKEREKINSWSFGEYSVNFPHPSQGTFTSSAACILVPLDSELAHPYLPVLKVSSIQL